MKSLLIFAFVLFCCPGSRLWAQASLEDDYASRSSPDNRLAKSAAALQLFRDSASDPTQVLLDSALCIGVAPRRGSGPSAADAKGFVSCRPSRAGSWSRPAAFTIEGGGTFWPVMGASIDVILLATNPVTASRFGDREGMLGTPNLGTKPGPVRLDQILLRNTSAVILAYEQSTTGIAGVDLAGTAIREDRSTNSVLYGKDLSNLAILHRNGGGPGPIAVELFLAALSPSISGQSGSAIAAQAVSPQPLVPKPE
jgi:lipid-binding SYLF domain-containing protein